MLLISLYTVRLLMNIVLHVRFVRPNKMDAELDPD